MEFFFPVRLLKQESHLCMPFKKSSTNCLNLLFNFRWEVKQLELQLDPKTPKWTFYKQAGPGTSDPSVTTSQTDTETSKEQLQKNSADSSEQQLDKGEKKDTERTEKQTLLETEKKKLKWL